MDGRECELGLIKLYVEHSLKIPTESKLSKT